MGDSEESHTWKFEVDFYAPISKLIQPAKNIKLQRNITLAENWPGSYIGNNRETRTKAL